MFPRGLPNEVPHFINLKSDCETELYNINYDNNVTTVRNVPNFVRNIGRDNK